MDIANLVQATAGREQGKYFFVLETDGEYLLLADGKSRRIEARKRKSKSMSASSQRARRLSPRRSEARKKSQTVSFVKPSPHTAARKIRTRRDNTWQNPT